MQLLLVACSDVPDPTDMGSHAPGSFSVGSLAGSTSPPSQLNLPVWTPLEADHLHYKVRPLEILSQQGPHPLLAYEVREIHKCLSLEDSLSSTLQGPPPQSVVDALATLVGVCQELSGLEEGDALTQPAIDSLADAVGLLGDLLWPG